MSEVKATQEKRGSHPRPKCAVPFWFPAAIDHVNLAPGVASSDHPAVTVSVGTAVVWFLSVLSVFKM